LKLTGKLWTASRLRQTFERLVGESKRPSVYIIDALDQCDEASLDTFVASFASLGSAGSSAKLLVLSRQGLGPSILSAQFPELVGFDMDEETDHGTAIKAAIKHQVAELCGKWRSLPGLELRTTITTKFSLRANGMYLLPMMIIKSLKKINATPANIERALHALPDDLTTAYREALDTIQKRDQQLAASVLLWVVFAKMPLSLPELSSAVCCR
jgi:hypothetical protein